MVRTETKELHRGVEHTTSGKHQRPYSTCYGRNRGADGEKEQQGQQNHKDLARPHACGLCVVRTLCRTGCWDIRMSGCSCRVCALILHGPHHLCTAQTSVV